MNLEEEILWGHTVCPLTKKVWSVEIDLAEKLLEVCQKHSLRIWACYGTLLGAVRHKGFIPWDDDMDFVMFRDDYEKLQKIASNEFTYPYFLQSIYTDAFCGGSSHLVRSNTTMIDSHFKNQKKHNTGIWVDIFVLDGVPDDDLEFNQLKKKVSFFRRIVDNYVVMNPKQYSFPVRLKHAFISVFCYILGVENLQRHIVKLLSANSIDNCKRVAPIDVMITWRNLKGPQAKTIFETAWFAETIMLPFHDIMIPVPVGYKELLTALYGDYLKPVKGAALHTTEIIDCEKSYDELIKENKFGR